MALENFTDSDYEEYIRSLSTPSIQPPVQPQAGVDEEVAQDDGLEDFSEEEYQAIGGVTPKPIPPVIETEEVIEPIETREPRSRKEMEQDEELMSDIKQHLKDRYDIDADERIPDFFFGYLFGGDEISNEEVLEQWMDRWRMMTGNSMDAMAEISWHSDLDDRYNAAKTAAAENPDNPLFVDEANKLAEQKARALRLYQQADEMAGLFGSKRYEGMGVLETIGEVGETVGVNVLAAVSDPTALFSVGAGKLVGTSASAAGVGLKQAILKAAATGAAVEATAAAATDVAIQQMEVEMGAREEIDYGRTATVAGIAGATAGVVSGWSTKNSVQRVDKATRGELTAALKANTEKQTAAARKTNKTLGSTASNIRESLAKKIEEKYGKEAIIRNKDGTVKELNSAFIRESEEGKAVFDIIDLESDLIQPSLSMDIFERVTAATGEIFKKVSDGSIKLVNPETGRAYMPKTQKAMGSKLQADEMVSERLLNIISSTPDEAMEEIAQTLGKYGITKREIAATMFADASIAGQKLNRLSQLSRQIGRAGRIKTAGEAAEEADGLVADKLGSTFRRLEDIRRLTLVSGVATAVRNNISQVLRSGVDTLVYGFESAINPNKKFGMRNTLAQLENTFFYQQDSANIAQFLLDLAPDQKMRFYNQFTEVVNKLAKKNPGQAMMNGKGSGMASESPILDTWENVVTSINFLNRFQEAVYRNGAFTTSIQRQLFDQGIDMMDVLKKGTITENISEDMIAKAVDDALEFTYASQPKTEIFRLTNNFIVKSGLTLAIPFPRFMFKALEMTYNYNATGAGTALLRMGLRKAAGGKVSDGMYRQLAEGVAGGVPLISLGYLLRDPDNDMAGSEWYMLKDGKGNEFDARPYFPLTPYLLIGEIIHRILEDRPVPSKFNTKELLEGFTGANFRGAGPISQITEDLLNAASGGGDLDFKYSMANLGEYLGEALSGYGQPLYQFGDIEVFGDMNQRKKDYNEDPEFRNGVDGFFEGFSRPFERRIGRIFENYTDMMDDLPDFEDPRYQDTPQRVMPLMKLMFGATFTRVPPKYVVELNRMGFTYKDFTTNTDTPSLNRAMNREMGITMNAEIPEVLATLREQYGDDQAAIAAEVRSWISERKSGIYTEMKLRDDTSGLSALQNKFKRMSPYQRNAAIKEFKKRYNREPADSEDIDQRLKDMYELNSIASSYRTMASQMK